MGCRKQRTSRCFSVNSSTASFLLVTSLFSASHVQANLELLVTSDRGFDQLQIAAARANQRTFDELNNGSCAGLELAATGQGNCSGDVFSAYSNTRGLVHTARELLGGEGLVDDPGVLAIDDNDRVASALFGDGPDNNATLNEEGNLFPSSDSIAFSRGGDEADLGLALRWTAGEEYAAQGSLSSEFVNSSLSSLAARLTALRVGARGFGLAGFSAGDAELLASQGRPTGGGASADGMTGFSRWGGFLDYSYGYGEKDATVLEDAFDYDGGRVNIGVDYRLDDNWVLGTMLGYLEQEVDFDASGRFVVDGSIESSGFNLMPYASYDNGEFFANASIGLQRVAFETDRTIRFASNNPNVSSVDTRSTSDTDASTVSFSAESGYQFRFAALAVEPYLGVEYLDTSIDGFVEKDVTVSTSDLDDFDLRVGGQDFTSTEIAIGVRAKYVFTPKGSVIIPLLDIQSRSQLEDDARRLSSGYTGMGNPAGATDFALPTDKVDDQYFTIAVGFSAVLRGGRPVSQGGVSSGGINIYCKYKTVQGLKDYSQNVLDFGLRYEF